MSADGARVAEPRWALTMPRLWAIVIIAGVFIVLSLWLVRPHDLWWHIRVGEWIVRNQEVPTIDHFSFTRAGEPYNYQMWLMEAILYLLYRAGDLPLIIFANAAVITGAYALLLKVSARGAGGSLRWASVATIGAAAVGLDNWNVRPQMMSFLLFAVVLYLINRHRSGAPVDRAWYREPRSLWCLPPLFALWANCHAGFAYGLVLLASYALAQLIRWLRRGRTFPAGLVVVSVLSAGAMLLTPRGVGIVEYVVGLFGHPVVRQAIVEWMPPTIRTRSGLLFLAFATAWLVLLLASRYRPGVYETISLLLFGVLALTAVRNGPWFAFVAAPVMAASGARVSSSRATRKREPARGQRNNVALAAAIGALVAFSLPWLRARVPLPSARRAYVSPETPLAAMDFVRGLDPAPRVFHSPGYGSTMMWFSPDVPVFVDTRFELYPPDMWEDYLAVSYVRYDWEAVLGRYGVDTLLLDRNAHRELIEAATAAPAWERVYEDGVSVAFQSVVDL